MKAKLARLGRQSFNSVKMWLQNPGSNGMNDDRDGLFVGRTRIGIWNGNCTTSSFKMACRSDDIRHDYTKIDCRKEVMDQPN
ncbi:hypothetical protein TMatcc_001348 [Talaromyces marneffei ATCC 18224]